MRAFIVLAVLVPALMAGAIFGLFIVWGDDLPTPRTPREIEPSTNTTLLDKNGQIIDEFFVENRNPVRLEDIPDVMKRAVLATEDRRFYGHWGIDLWGVFRALRTNVASHGISQGGSTITQQLARNLFLSNSQTFERKLKETVLAVRLERSFSKDEIMELYLNQIYFGEGAYGVKAAASRYFGKALSDITAPEAAMIAGLAANPSAYSPLRHPEAARARRNVVLRRMEQAGVFSEGEREALEEMPVETSTSERPRSRSVGADFSEMIRRELIERYGADQLYRGGLKVYTTLDAKLQQAAQGAIEHQMVELEKQHAWSYKYLLSPATRMGTLQATGGSTPYLQGALVAVEPQTGAIRAMVGGRNFSESSFNRATQARRQPGSSFKPFIYATAFTQGWKTGDLLQDSPASWSWAGPGGRRQVWSPQNFSHKYAGPVTLRYALMKSINVPAIRLLERVGSKNVIEIAHAMGIRGELPTQLSLALGTGEVTPLEITGAYATFANQGIFRAPYAIERVEDRYGRILESHDPAPREALDERSSYLTLSIMRSVLDFGTAWKARGEYKFKAPAAGKTGTTDDYSDAWFVGFIPRLACGVWVGFDEKKPIGPKMTGAAAALPAWCEFMNAAVAVYGEEEFTPPPGIVEVTTCTATGKIATAACPKTAKDAYRVGQAPSGVCTLHTGGLEHETPGEDGTEDE